MKTYVCVPTVAMRAAPKMDAEVVSQALFSEQVMPLDATGDWLHVETICDGYRGWIERSARCECATYPATDSTVATVARNAVHLYSIEDTIYGPLLTLPFESRLQVLESIHDRWLRVLLPDQRTACVQRGDVTLSTQRFISRQEMCAFSTQFLGLPYTWGGRSSFGYDCSGYVQMLYRQLKIALPRDARQQIHWQGFVPGTRNQLQPGDLIFFGLDEVRIQHVGMSLGGERFIHATVAENAPFVRISSLNDNYWNGAGKYPYSAIRLLSEINPIGAPDSGQA